MAYVCYDCFLREVMPFCNGVPEVVAINAVRNAAIEFCEETQWLQYSFYPMSGVANLSTYTPDTPSDTRLGRVVDIYYDTFKLLPASVDTLSAQWGVDWQTITGQPRWYTHTTSAPDIVVTPVPQITESAAITGLLSIVPLRTSNTCDGDLFEYWAETIASGAVARLMATPQQPYSNMTGSIVYARRFRDGIGKAKIERNRGMDRGMLNLRPPRFI